MLCPYCQSPNLRVFDKRDSVQNTIRRRRKCLNCHRRFTTREKISALDLIVIKKDGRNQKYDQEKLVRGIKKSCEKRPISEEKVNQLIAEIEAEICRLGKKKVKSSVIGKIVIDNLKKVDMVAYLRFASVFYPFASVDDFEKEIDKLAKENKKFKSKEN